MKFNRIKELLSNKKVLLGVALGSVLLVVLIISISLFVAHAVILKNTEKMAAYYDDFSTNKNGYTITTDVVKMNDTDYLYFTVEDENGVEIVNSLDDELVWRVMDFKEINFRETSLDIVISSADVGDTVYIYKGNGEWIAQ